MTPQERLFQATQQLAVAQSKVDSAKKADDAASDTLYTLTAAAAVAATKLAFDTTAQAAAIAAEPIASEALAAAGVAETTATAVLTAASADLAAAGVAAGLAAASIWIPFVGEAAIASAAAWVYCSKPVAASVDANSGNAAYNCSGEYVAKA